MSATTYDQKPYFTVARPESHPARIAAIARLMDLPAKAPDSCRVLEIGCGTGGNIIPWAESFPQSSFVGIDSSAAQIEIARRVVHKLGLKNIELRVADISTCTVEPSVYDYIVCHGVYSWVSEDVQQRILEVCKSALSKQGVVFLSYNILPGWRQRGFIRDIMMYGASRESSNDPDRKIQAATRFLELVVANRKRKGDPFAAYLEETVSRMQGSHSSYLFHEFLEENNRPCLFSEFMKEAMAFGLQFLSEARPAFGFADDLGEQENLFLADLHDDLIGYEQALDIFRNRMLRETLLCHSDFILKRDLRASVFRSLVFSTEYRRLGDNGGRDVAFRELTSGRNLALPRDSGSAVLIAVGEAGPAGCDLPGVLHRLAQDRTSSVGEEEAFQNIVALWRAGFVEAAPARYRIVSKPVGMARTSALVRLQVAEGESATSLRHRQHTLSSTERLILSGSDGTRDFQGVLNHVEKVAPGTTSAALVRLLELGFFADE